MTGLERIRDAFQTARADGRAALMPYFTLGYPDARRLAGGGGGDRRRRRRPDRAGRALLRPAGRRPDHPALHPGGAGAGHDRARAAWSMVADLRRRGVSQPLLLMGYVNPILAYGVERFAADAARPGRMG